MNVAESGNRITFNFCPDCGSDVHYEINGKFDGLVAIPLGAFDDPYFASPAFSVWEERKHDWVEILGEVEHIDLSVSRPTPRRKASAGYAREASRPEPWSSRAS